VQGRGQGLGQRPAREGAAGRDHLVQDAAEGEQVAAVIGREAAGLFGGHVGRRPQHRPDLGEGRLGDVRRLVGVGVRTDPRQAEVEDLHPAAGREEEVVRLQVPVDDAAAVRRRQPLGDGDADLQRGPPVEGRPGQPLAQGFALK
jgi:hypothetical protein